jgi:hypothetical protein
MLLQPAFRPGPRIALMDKFGTPWSGHGENLPVAFSGRNKSHGSFDHSPARPQARSLVLARRGRPERTRVEGLDDSPWRTRWKAMASAFTSWLYGRQAGTGK